MAFLLIDSRTLRSLSTPPIFRAADTHHGPWISTGSVSLLSVPSEIRGFGVVKERNYALMQPKRRAAQVAFSSDEAI
jgi:hypothetical protein